ncbi:MAG TPA: FGLLP motif-containing membrane protein [Candidatus Dormibacteraeota bacterium]
MRRLLALPLVAVALVLSSAQASAATSNVADAIIQGPWHLLVTVAGYTGPPDALRPGAVQPAPVGHQALDTVWFQSACQVPGDCAIRIYGPQGPNQPNFYGFYSTSSGFQGPPVSQGLQQSGSTYTIPQIQIGGFGGFTCSPPPPPRPTETLSLRVTEAKPGNLPGYSEATTITGSETLIDGWGCSGSQGSAWRTKTLTILGHPVGYAIPAPVQPSGLTVSSLASALNPPDRAFRTPLLIVANLLITALVILFVTFPAAIFNHTLSTNYDEISSAVRPLIPLRDLFRRAANRRGDTLVFGATLLAGAWLNGQLDPNFAFDRRSLTNYLAMIITILFGVTVSTGVAILYRLARGREREWHPHALPLGLGIAALCVVISRLTGFAPGYFYGLVAGVAFGTTLAKHEAGHTAALASLTTMALAVVAWFAWAAVNPHAQANGAWPVVLIDDFLGSVFVGGLVGNVVGLLPLRSLQGGTLIGWHRGVWGGIFAIAVFGMVQVLLHPEQGAVHPSGAPLVTAILLFIGFGGGSIAFNRYFTWQGRPTRPRPQEAVATA